MTRNGENKKKLSNAKDPEWGGFLELRLTDEEKAAFAVYERDHPEDVWIKLQEWVMRGLKFSLSYDKSGDYYTATFTGSGVELVGMEQRFCLTARAPEWQQAVFLLVFKHTVLAKGDWSKYRPRTHQFSKFE